jgi:hypothetical protein
MSDRHHTMVLVLQLHQRHCSVTNVVTLPIITIWRRIQVHSPVAVVYRHIRAHSTISLLVAITGLELIQDGNQWTIISTSSTTGVWHRHATRDIRPLPTPRHTRAILQVVLNTTVGESANYNGALEE